MSFDRLPDEVLLKILRLALTSEKPITTSIKAHKIYQTWLDCITMRHKSVNLQSAEQWNALLSGISPRRTLPISPLLLGTSRRWYRLGSPFFYHANTFVIMHRELGAFANKTSFHNSKSIRSVELTVFHKDVDAVPKISLLNKSYSKQVESVKVILAKRYKIHKTDPIAEEKEREWNSVIFGMIKMTRKLRSRLETQQRQSAGWKVVEKGETNVVNRRADYGIMSARWVLERLRKPPKVYKKQKAVTEAEGMFIASEENVGLGGVDAPKGSIVSEERETEEGSEKTATPAIDTDLPTPDTTPDTAPEITPEPESKPNEGARIEQGNMESTTLAIDTGLPTPESTPETTREPTTEPMTIESTAKMLPLPYWGR